MQYLDEKIVELKCLAELESKRGGFLYQNQAEQRVLLKACCNQNLYTLDRTRMSCDEGKDS
jgi:hypothetical protein